MDDGNDQDVTGREMFRYMADIPPQLAQAAHAFTSHVPERRGDQERESYARQLVLDFAELEKLATTDEKREILVREFARYRAGYRQRTIARLTARSRCASTMITGGANFNVRRNEKANRRADARAEGAADFRALAIAAIRKALTPELQPIRVEDADALTRLDAQISRAERLQAQMAEANAVIRKHKKAGKDAQIAALVAIGYAHGVAVSLLDPDFAGRIGFADYQLKNNGAEIRRLKARRASIAVAKEAPTTEQAGAIARMEDAPADNRVRLFFPGKPDDATRARLKASGFRWAPSLGCWQAYRNARSLAVAAREIGGAP